MKARVFLMVLLLALVFGPAVMFAGDSIFVETRAGQPTIKLLDGGPELIQITIAPRDNVKVRIVKPLDNKPITK